MGLERYVVDAVVLEGRGPTEIARLHGISRSWLYRLFGRYREGGYAALAPRSRRPHSCCGPSWPRPVTTPGRRRSPTISAAASRRFPRRRRYGASFGATG